MLVRSQSRMVEVFYRPDGDPLQVYPHFCVDREQIRPSDAPCLTRGYSLLEELKKDPAASICFWRSYALGDILLLTPIVNWIKEEYPACELWLATSTRFIDLFKHWDAIRVVETRRVLAVPYDVGYMLDGVVEVDHMGGADSYRHRLDIYCRFLGIPIPKDPLFSLPYGEEERLFAERVIEPLRKDGKPVVVFQLFGSTEIKQLPLSKSADIARALTDICSIVFVHGYAVPVLGVEALNLSGKTNVHQLAAVLDCADAVVTMDSGVLWVAHCTKTPVIALLGPTREAERLTYHRAYSVVNLSEMVGCEPCFERMTRCAGTVDCMRQSDTAKIIGGIRSGIRTLVGA